jgi:hypothetical protein
MNNIMRDRHMTTRSTGFSTRKGHAARRPVASLQGFRNAAREKGAIGACLAAAAVIALLAGCTRGPDATLFEDVTELSGLGGYTGMTYGAAWGDYNGDGLPDLYVTNHLNGARLYQNRRDCGFADVSREVFPTEDLGDDKHGAAWGDFDNDGLLDLVQLTGAGRGVGSEPKRLFRNLGERLEDMAEALGVANLYGRTRMPLWFDLDRDGNLDLFHGAEARHDDLVPPFLFLQRDHSFREAVEALRFATRSIPFCILTSLNDDSYPELVCRAAGGKDRTAQVFDTAILPAKELKLLPVTAFEDIAAGDFDNDGHMDLFLARNNPPGRIALGRQGSNVLIADLLVTAGDAGKPMGFGFRSPGRVTLQINPMQPSGALSTEDIRIGRQGWHPAELAFSLSPETAGINGIAAGQAGAKTTVHIGLEPPDKWQVQILGPARDEGAANRKHQQIAVKVSASEPVTDHEVIGGITKPEEAPARLFMNRGGKLVEESERRGVNDHLVAGVNVVSGDFDNDMDLDLFVLASGLVGKHRNLLLLNRGDGHFEADLSAGGAAGQLGGVGDSVTTVDFDADGFLDLFIATGGSMGRSLGLPSDDGGYQLYRNVGNGNHWLEIDLEGTASNRDGIGARVEVVAGGVSQLRIQDGGVHHRGQNHSRLHFGLGLNEQVETIRVQWPSGTVQELSGVEANQLLRITEPAT